MTTLTPPLHINILFEERTGCTTGFFEENQTLPLIVEPVDPTLSLAEQITFLKKDLAWLKAQMIRFGALLFRGFPTTTTNDFQTLLEGLEVAMMPYVGGVGLRGEPIQSMIYKSTNFPSHLDLHVHNEAMYHKRLSPNHYFLLLNSRS